MSGVPRVSVVMPACQEAATITGVLDRIFASVTLPCEVLVVVDAASDPTAGVVAAYARREPRLSCLISAYGRGPASAIRFGMDAARAEVIVVTMADGSDDPAQIDDLARLVEQGAVVAAASRYMTGGRQLGGPRIKGLLSQSAGRSLHALAGAGTRDATNSFKGYSTAFARCVGIDSRRGFEIGIELTAKARRLRLPVAEIPTVWRDRPAGTSSFRLVRWLPGYLRWYWLSFGPPLTAGQLRARSAARAR